MTKQIEVKKKQKKQMSQQHSRKLTNVRAKVKKGKFIILRIKNVKTGKEMWQKFET